MHLLDLVMYFIILFIIYKLLGEEYTTEIGGLVGCFIALIYTFVYIIIFVVFDYNWIDIFTYLFNIIEL